MLTFLQKPHIKHIFYILYIGVYHITTFGHSLSNQVHSDENFHTRKQNKKILFSK